MLPRERIWKRRWVALRDDILSRRVEIESHLRVSNGFIEDYDRNKINALITLLNCLREFAEEYINYFFALDWGKFEGGEYPSDYVLATILDQIGNDMETFSRIANDHFAVTGRRTLRLADKLAEQALQLAINEDWFEAPPFVLSYYQKSPLVRVIPYANVLMLGIPYSSQLVEEDFLAIPHEVGHQVFWQGNLGEGYDEKTIAQYLLDREIYKKGDVELEDWSYRWVEEMFADIYGMYVGGGISALSFQDLLLQNSPRNLIQDDRDHPVPILRPKIHAKTLDFLGLKKSALGLEERWKSILQELADGAVQLPEARYIDKIYFSDCKDDFIQVHPSEDEKGAMSDGLKLNDDLDVDRVIKTIIEIFKPVGGKFGKNSGKWKEIVDEIEGDYKCQPKDEDTFKKFRDSVKGLGKGLRKNGMVANLEPSEIFCYEPQDLIDAWVDKDVYPYWRPVFVAGGWTTEGPKCPGSGQPCG